MKLTWLLTWLGQSGFRIEIEDQTLLVDPWLSGNRVFPEKSRDAEKGATHILLTHGHSGHTGDALAQFRETGRRSSESRACWVTNWRETTMVSR